MKSKLLKRIRKEIQILNIYGKPADETDKKCHVVRVDGRYLIPFITTKNKDHYINYGNALNRRREEILKLARAFTHKKWWNVFS